ncbi:hypothetical protein AB0G79_20215 [Streptomyces sp. NPDC020807]
MKIAVNLTIEDSAAAVRDDIRQLILNAVQNVSRCSTSLGGEITLRG